MPDPEKVFKIERDGECVVVLPQGPALQFNHREVHLESNALYRVIDDPKLKNVIVDLSPVPVRCFGARRAHHALHLRLVQGE